MPKSTKGYVEKDVLITAPLPEQTETYTVISHEFVINTTLQTLNEAGFVVNEQLYRCNQDAKVAQGLYKLNYGNDPDLSMIFTWVNSYDKSMKFRCAIGANVNSSGVAMMKRASSWERKHTGKALEEASQTIQAIIGDADVFFNELVDIKNLMKEKVLSESGKAIEEQMNHCLDMAETCNNAGETENAEEANGNASHLAKSLKANVKRSFGHLMGDLFFTKRIINGDQAGIIMRESDEPTHTYNSGVNSLWTAYNYVLTGFRVAHPRLWMDMQTRTLLHFMDEYDLVTFDPEPAEVEEVVPPVTGQGEFEENVEEEEVDDTPEITGIPDGNTMSDTDDDNDIVPIDEAEAPQLVDVTAEDDGKLIPEYKASEELKEEWDQITRIEEGLDHKGDFALEEEGSMHAEDLQNVPADNVKEATEAVTDESGNDKFIYLEAGDYPGAAIGQFVEVDDIIYEINGETEVEGTTYFSAVEYQMEAGDSVEETTTEGNTVERDAEEDEYEAIQKIADVKIVEHVEPKAVDEVELPVIELPEALAEHKVDMEESSDETELKDVVFDEEEIPDDTNFELPETNEEESGRENIETTTPLFNAVAAELEDLYGQRFDNFNIEQADDQYNITLASGEQVVLSVAYVDSLMVQ